MGEWQPNPEGLQQIVRLIALSQSPDTEVQRQVHQQLLVLRNIPEYDKYLTFLFTRLRDQDETIRMVAGLTLKNNVKDYFMNMAPDVRHYIRDEVFHCIGDPKTAIRRTAGTIITTIVDVGGLEECPGLIGLFIQMLSTNDVNLIDGTLSAIYKICQDSAEKLDDEEHKSGGALTELFAKLFHFFGSEHEPFRRFALGSVNQFIICMPRVLRDNFEIYMKGLFHLANDASPEVKVLVCQAMITLVEVRFDYIEPYIEHIIRCILVLNRDEDENVSLEACEFWPSIAESRSCPEVLARYLPDILPILLDGMVYSDVEVSIFDAEEEDAHKPDLPQDIRPFIYKSKRGEDGDDEEDPSDWSLRKCSAAGLDVFANEFGREILPHTLPLLQRRLENNDEWEQRESAILALGAIAEGCGPDMEPHLAMLIPFLLHQMGHPKPMVRAITCWTICRYGEWIVEQHVQALEAKVDPAATLLGQLLGQLLPRLLDPHKRVQEAAVSALATLEEVARHHLQPYLTPILLSLREAYSKYQAKNLLILYDAIGTLAEAVGGAFNKPEYIEILLPPLIAMWNALPDDDIRLFPLLECLAPVVTALGLGFSQFAPPVYHRCLKLVEATLTAELQNQKESADKDFIVCSLDLISGLVEGLKEHAPALVKDSNLFQLLFACMKHPSTDVRQSAFALVGELSKFSIALLRTYLGEYLPVMAGNLQAEYHSACNNACWAIGEVVMRVGRDMEGMADDLVKQLVRIINSGHYNRCLLENSAITLGRLGLAMPERVAPHLSEFLKRWCYYLRAVRDDDEKESAFKGICMMVQHNPHGAVKHFSYLADAMASWKQPPQDLQAMFHHILHSFKQSLGPEAWQNIIQTWPPGLVSHLAQLYQL